MSRTNGLTRRSVLALGSAVVAGGVAGCADGGTGSGDADGDSGSGDTDALLTHDRWGRGETALSYRTSDFYTPIEAESSQPAAAPALRTQHEQWAEAHPEYHIDVEYPAFGQWKDDLVLDLSQGDGPDGSTLDSSWVADFYEFLQPLNDSVDDIDDFFPFVRDVTMQDGDLLAGWKYTGCRCLYYRQDLIDRYGDGTPPRTWDDLIALGEDIADGEEITPFLFRSEPFDNLPYFWGQGGELVDDEGAPVLGEESNRRAMVNVLSFIRELVDTGVTPQRVANIEDVEDLPREGRNDQLAMFIGNNDLIEREFKNVVEDDSWQRWQVAQIPMMEPDQFATGVGGWTEGAFIEGNDDDAAAMTDFISKFVEPDAMARYCAATNFLPTRESAYDSEFYGENAIEYQDTFRELLQDGVARPAVPIYSTIASEYGDAIERVVTGQAGPADATDRMIAAVDEEYDG
jgi:multiple sugar transport system substrate-binding protein